MPIASTDLILKGPLSNPIDDVAASGGAPDAQRRPVFTQLLANSTMTYVSSGADTRTATTTGRDITGAVVSEGVVLNGTTPVSGSQIFERIQLTSMSASGAQTVTAGGSGVGNLAQIPPGEIAFYMNFRNSASDTSQKIRYEKVFFRNNHATLTLNSAQIQLFADPSGVLQIGLTAAKNDSTSVSNRLAAPGGVSFVGVGVNQSVVGTTLEALAYQGVWVSQTLAANNAPIKNSFTLQLTGTTV